MAGTDKNNQVYSFMFDEFASELGSTLDDLATNWEDNTQDDSSEYSDSLSSSSRNPSIVSSQSADNNNMDEFSRKAAKPLHFHNPVFHMFYKGPAAAQIPRQTLIPIKQSDNENKNHETGKYIKKEKKKHGHHGKIMSKLAAVGRRQSQPKISVTKEYYVSDQSVIEDDYSFASETSETTSENKISEKKDEPKIDAPELLKIPESNPMPKPLPRKSPPTSEETVTYAAPKISKTPSPEKTVPQSVFLSPEKSAFSASKIPVDPQGSPSSSSPSEGEMSADGMTMADVMDEIATVPIINKQEPTEKPDKGANSEEKFVEQTGLLRRDKTLKWSGTRKAPGLIREFTKKQKKKQKLMDSSGMMGSPNKEVEAVTRLKTDNLGEIERPRSCTPSRQFSSFGMNEDASDTTETEESLSDGLSSPIDSSNESKFSEPYSPSKVKNKRESAFIVLSSLLPPAPRLRRSHSSKVRAFLQKMGTNVNNALGYAVTQFVEQTLKNKEKRPLVLLHDIRSFLTDIKRYLISNPHLGLKKKIEKIVNYNTSVDVEGAVDDALDRLVLYPLHNHIYRCLVIDYTKSGKLKNLEEAMACAKLKTKTELGIREDLIPPDAESIEVIKGHFINLQKTYSPYFKLKELLAAVMKIYESTQDLSVNDRSAKKIGADDFLPLLVYSIVKCEFVASDIEAQYIDGLLDPSLLLGEGGYYLTTLISAIQVIFSIKRREVALPNISDLQGFLKVGIASLGSDQEQENDDLVLHKTLHVPPAMNCKSLCSMIARKFNIATPSEYCLHVVVNGIAHALEPSECPQLVKMDLLTQFSASSFYFSFQKRQEEKTEEDVAAVIMSEEDKGKSIVEKPKQQNEKEEVKFVVGEILNDPVSNIPHQNQEEDEENKKDLDNGENEDQVNQKSESLEEINPQKIEDISTNLSQEVMKYPEDTDHKNLIPTQLDQNVITETVPSNPPVDHGNLPDLNQPNVDVNFNLVSDKKDVNKNHELENVQSKTEEKNILIEQENVNEISDQDLNGPVSNFKQTDIPLLPKSQDQVSVTPYPKPDSENTSNSLVAELTEIPTIVVEPVVKKSPKRSPKHSKLPSIDENLSSDDQVFSPINEVIIPEPKQRPKSESKIEIPKIFIKKSTASDPGMPEKNLSAHSSTEEVFCKISPKRVSRYGKESVASLTEYFESQTE